MLFEFLLIILISLNSFLPIIKGFCSFNRICGRSRIERETFLKVCSFIIIQIDNKDVLIRIKLIKDRRI